MIIPSRLLVELVLVLAIALVDIAVTDLNFPLDRPFSARKLLDESYAAMSSKLAKAANAKLRRPAISFFYIVRS